MGSLIVHIVISLSTKRTSIGGDLSLWLTLMPLQLSEQLHLLLSVPLSYFVSQSWNFWIEDKNRMNGRHLASQFRQEIDEYFQQYQAFVTAQGNSNCVPHGPPFSLDNWIGFETRTKDYFGSILGREGVPLSYVIRDNADHPVLIPASSRHNKIYWNAPLFGAAFNADNLLVWTYLLHWCSKTPGWIRTQQYRATNNGRDPWFALCRNHGV